MDATERLDAALFPGDVAGGELATATWFLVVLVLLVLILLPKARRRARVRLADHDTRQVSIKPLGAFRAAWSGAWRVVLADNGTCRALLAIFAAAPALEIIFARVVPLSPRKMFVAGFAWQAITAMLLAALAVRLHRSALGVAAPAVAPLWRLQFRAALWGLGIFLALKAFSLGAAILAAFLPGGLAQPANLANMAFSAILFVPFAFVRPALALGYSSPLRAAFSAVRAKPVRVVAWIVALSLPLELFRMSLALTLPHLDLRPAGPGLFVYQAALVLFNVFNFSAFEMTVALTLRNLNTRWREHARFPD